MATVANFIWFLGVISILAVALRPGSQIGTALNGTSNLVTNSIKAAKS
jgi:hypothetical protein